jgi:hypothetical protein
VNNVTAAAPFQDQEGQEADPLSQKNKLLNALDGLGFQTPKRKNSDAKIERVYYLVSVCSFDFLVENDIA